MSLMKATEIVEKFLELSKLAADAESTGKSDDLSGHVSEMKDLAFVMTSEGFDKSGQIVYSVFPGAGAALDAESDAGKMFAGLEGDTFEENMKALVAFGESQKIEESSDQDTSDQQDTKPPAEDDGSGKDDGGQDDGVVWGRDMAADIAAEEAAQPSEKSTEKHEDSQGKPFSWNNVKKGVHIG